MNVATWLKQAKQKLSDAGIDSARLDAEVIVADFLSVDRSWLNAHSEDKLTAKQEAELVEKIDLRIKHEPVAYILGSKEFYGRSFIVNKHVLVPRPESESFIEMLGSLKDIKTILDIGTGSGCLAITAKLQYPSLDVFATDISEQALEIATTNAKNLNASIEFKVQNLLDNDKNHYDVILANLPYVPGSMQDKSIMHEPKIALFSGDDGLDHYRKLFLQLEEKSVRFILVEALAEQHADIEKLARNANYVLTKTHGLVQLFSRITS